MPTDNSKDPAISSDRERLLLAVHKVIGSALPTKPRDDVSEALLHAGIFRSITIALVVTCPHICIHIQS